MYYKSVLSKLCNIPLDPCPFCGGSARLSTRDIKFKGQNYQGVKLLRYAAYGMCNKCHATGNHVYGDVHYGSSEYADELTKLLSDAANGWNNRESLNE